MAAPSLKKPISSISNLERMNAQLMGRVRDCDIRTILESTRWRLWDQVKQRKLKEYVFEDIWKDLKLTFR
jgi:hypothetical protein